MHNDLGAEHVLLDENTSEPVGIIDFKSATIGDPAVDFVPLRALLGPGAMTEALQGRDLGPRLDRRLWFYRWMGSVHAIIYGITEGLEEERSGGIAVLRRRIATPS